ncbi:UNVERIFIED_CONTAM: hypothetical protein Sradi_5969100 [Sesamum radiatum]|uniref:Peptidase S26 domain-containing protein n=1 Tax=Sesamum radiatum TaxID=300843 RepID=A0AAW2KGC0_SESRA
MGMERLQELAPFVKDALHQTARVANAFCFLHVANTYLCSVAKLVGPSMLPTFNHGTYVLTESITSRLGAVGSGDAVLIRSPEEPRKVVAKRVKGVEGDVVSYVLDPSESEERKTVVVIVFSPFPGIYKNEMLS